MVYKKRAYAKKRVARRRSKTMTKKPTFDKRVKTVISRMAENKNQNTRGTVNLYQYGAASWGNSIICCTPETLFLTINQGTGQGDRVGNSIRVKSLKLTGVVRALPYNLTTNQTPLPCYVKFMFLTRKDTPTDIFGGLTELLKYGNSDEGPGNASLLRNLYRPINTEMWTPHTTRIFKIGNAEYAGTGGTAGTHYFSNNDFKMNSFVNIDLTKYCTKVVKFNDNVSGPTTRNVVLYPILYTADGSVLNNNSPVAFDYSLDIVYEDF